MSDEQQKDTSDTYEIRIRGQLDTKWSDWFYGMTIIHEGDGSSTLYGALPDQIVLHSVLDRIRDMNLQLISVRQMTSDKATMKDESEGENDEK